MLQLALLALLCISPIIASDHPLKCQGNWECVKLGVNCINGICQKDPSKLKDETTSTEPYYDCYTHNDCPRKSFCLAGTCIGPVFIPDIPPKTISSQWKKKGCKKNSDCRDGMQCWHGMCVHINRLSNIKGMKSNGCDDDLDCTDGTRCFNHLCQDFKPFSETPYECRKNSECGFEETCNAGICVNWPFAFSNGIANKLTSNTNRCLDNSHCTGNRICVAGRCSGEKPKRMKLKRCDDDLDCTDGTRCFNHLCQNFEPFSNGIANRIPSSNIRCAINGFPCLDGGKCVHGKCLNDRRRIIETY